MEIAAGMRVTIMTVIGKAFGVQQTLCNSCNITLAQKIPEGHEDDGNLAIA